MQAPISPPKPEELLSPLLASLPAASISPSPPTALLPSLSPILRQRVQLLSSASSEPWLPLLCYDTNTAAKLSTVVKSEKFEPHPVSGEVEVDWDYDVEVQYKRVDEETLQSLVSLRELELAVKLIWCTNDQEGGADGWRIGEVAVWEPASSSWGSKSVSEAEEVFTKEKSQSVPGNLSSYSRPNGTNSLLTPEAESQEEDDDDDYWAQYDNTPARTPAPKHSPAPQTHLQSNGTEVNGAGGDEDSYYAQYASVQPAMDNHDPDEAQQNGDIESSLGKDEVMIDLQSMAQTEVPQHRYTQSNEVNPWSNGDEVPIAYTNGADREREAEGLAMPRPASSTGSSGSDTVAKLEKRAAKEAQSEVGIKQHIGTSVKSLYRLAKVAGIDRQEFERIVRTELDCLSLMDEDDA